MKVRELPSLLPDMVTLAPPALCSFESRPGFRRRIFRGSSLRSKSLAWFHGSQLLSSYAPGRVFSAKEIPSADIGESISNQMGGKIVYDQDLTPTYPPEDPSGIEEGSSNMEPLRSGNNMAETSEASTSSLLEMDQAELLSRSVYRHRKGYKNRVLLLAKLGTTIKKSLESFFKSEIRQRALVTVLMLIAVRAGHFIPLPGFDRRFMPGDYLTYVSGPGESVELVFQVYETFGEDMKGVYFWGI